MDGTGIHDGLKIRCLRACGFESHHTHHFMGDVMKFKVGDKVRLVEDGWGVSDANVSFLKSVVFEVEDYDEQGYFREAGYKVSPSIRSLVELDEEPGEDGYIGEESFELVEEAPQTSNEKPSFVSFFTSVIVAKNRAVSDIGEVLYDENTTKIYLEDEGGGVFLIVEQDYNGAIQQIRLNIDEVDTVFSAIKQLVNQMDVK